MTESQSHLSLLQALSHSHGLSLPLKYTDTESGWRIVKITPCLVDLIVSSFLPDWMFWRPCLLC